MSALPCSSSLPATPRPTPPACGVPVFGPVRVGRGGGYRLHRVIRRRRRSMAAGLAMTAAAMAAATIAGAPPGGPSRPEAHADSAAPPGAGTPPGAAPAAGPGSHRRSEAGGAVVSAPVRIADAGAARLLHPGDRVDVLATGSPAGRRAAAAARVIARAVRVSEVPEPSDTGPGTGPGIASNDLSAGGGTLVVLTVPRSTAVALAGAGANSRLVVTVC